MINLDKIESIFFSVLEDLKDYLCDLTLVGGWMPYVYSRFLWNNPTVKPVTTVDIDFGFGEAPTKIYPKTIFETLSPLDYKERHPRMDRIYPVVLYKEGIVPVDFITFSNIATDVIEKFVGRQININKIDKIKFATDETTFKRAVGLYESGKVTEVEEAFGDWTAVVLGTKPYRVSISGRNYKNGHCNCYLGQKDTLCKHMVALALYAVMDGQPLNDKDKQLSNHVECSRRIEALNKEELVVVKKTITDSMRYIKPYRGPSRTWFANQDSLREGCNRLSAIVSDLPVNKQAADILVKLLLRLDKKLRIGGVDDSNGIVGGFMSKVVEILEEFAQIDPDCINAFEPLAGRETCFDWEEPLVRIFDERDYQE